VSSKDSKNVSVYAYVHMHTRMKAHMHAHTDKELMLTHLGVCSDGSS
jgi:hypothetical protein